MKLPLIVLFFSLLFYLIYHIKLQFSSYFSNKFVLFIIFNFVILLTIIINNFSGTRVTVTHGDTENSLILLQCDDDMKRSLQRPTNLMSSSFREKLAVSHNASFRDELVVEKSIILVEKYSKEEQLVEEEETTMGIVYNDYGMKVRNEDDTGWQLVAVESFIPENEVKEIVSVENDLNKLELDALNRKFDEFISLQKRKWQLDAYKQRLQLVKI